MWELPGIRHPLQGLKQAGSRAENPVAQEAGEPVEQHFLRWKSTSPRKEESLVLCKEVVPAVCLQGVGASPPHCLAFQLSLRNLRNKH